MSYSPKFWRRLSYILSLALLYTLVRLHIQTGYPAQWRSLEYGMSMAEVRSVLGPEDEHPPNNWKQAWTKRSPVGTWALLCFSDNSQKDGSGYLIGTDVRFQPLYRTFLFLRIHEAGVSIKDRGAFRTAIGGPPPEPEGVR